MNREKLAEKIWKYSLNAKHLWACEAQRIRNEYLGIADAIISNLADIIECKEEGNENRY